MAPKDSTVTSQNSSSNAEQSNKCCCCMSFKAGAYLIAVFGILSALALVGAVSYLIISLKGLKLDYTPVFYAQIGSELLYFIMCIVLIIAIASRSNCGYIIFITFTVLNVLTGIATAIVAFMSISSLKHAEESGFSDIDTSIKAVETSWTKQAIGTEVVLLLVAFVRCALIYPVHKARKFRNQS